ncbi:MAG: hypothetical protein MUC49_16365 [Raineya sp.]|jgi:hypothetical protein|nr:hypothetical protein [Raineya sp.]
MKKFVYGLSFIVLLQLDSCKKPQCPTYMTPKEFAAYEAQRDAKGRTNRRDKNGHIKKKSTRVDKVKG